MRSPTHRALITLAACSQLGGCYIPFRLGIGPTVDSSGQVGFIAQAALGLGGEERPSTVGGGITGSLSAGAIGPARTPMLVGRVEPYLGVRVGPGDLVFLRLGALLGGRVHFSPELEDRAASLGIGLSSLFRIFGDGFLRGSFGADGSRWVGYLGPEVQIEYAFGDIRRGYFSFPLMLEIDGNVFK